MVLMRGGTGAGRPFVLGMTDGPEGRELQANLIALQYATGLFSAPTGTFDWPTADAVERWQLANGYPVTGEITLGQVVFLPSAVLGGAQNAAPRQAATPGQQPYQVTTDLRIVRPPLNPDLPPAAAGAAVFMLLPSETAPAGAGPP